jgi:hypothetical protein
MTTRTALLAFLSLLLTTASIGQTAASGYAVTTVATGFASQSYGVGPTGLALNTAGNIYVSECYCVGSSPTQGIYKFSSVGGIASAAPVATGQVLVLTLTGNLPPSFGGTAISGQDVVVINK